MTDTPSEFITDTRRIVVRRFKAGSMFKLVLAGVSVFFGPMIIFFGVLAFFGAKTVQFSGEYVTGIKGLTTALIMAPFFIGVLSLFGWLAAYIGIRVVGYFKPLTLEYVPAEEATTTPREQPSLP